MTHITRRVFAAFFVAISRPQHPATHNAFSRRISLRKQGCQIETWYFSTLIFLITFIFNHFALLTTVILLMCKIKCNARDNKADIKKQYPALRYIRCEHKTNSESSVFKAKSQNQIRIKCIQGKISMIYERPKKADIKNNTPATDALAK